MTSAGEILVGVDGSAASEATLRWAMREAGLRSSSGVRSTSGVGSASVVALLAWTADGLPRSVFHEATRADHDGLAAAAADVLERTIERAGEPAAAVAVRRLVVEADPVDALVKHAATAAVVVVGARGHGAVHRMLAGSVSQGVVHHSPVPVVVVRGAVASLGKQALDTRPVVVGVDGSPGSLAALRWAAVAANHRHVQLRVVHAWGGSEQLDAALLPAVQGALVRQAQHVLYQTVASGAGEAANVEAAVVHGSAAAALVRESTDAQLVVVGSRGRGGFAELVLGSVSHQCVLYAACPVAVVHGGQP